MAVAFISVPSALAVAVVPLLSRGQFHALLSFLVALAVGTLCGDALLHLWPHVGTPHDSGMGGTESGTALTAPPLPIPSHPTPANPPQAQGQHQEAAAVLRAVLQGLAVLGGIYALLLLELLLGMLRRRRAATVGTAGTGRAPGAPPSPAVPIASALLLPAPSPWRDPRGGRGGPGPTARR